MKVTPEIARIIMEDGNAIEIKDAALKQGFRDLRRSGILKVLKGTTSIQEMYRVTSE
jgi:type IV pilus assembly protein PilB